MAKKKHYVRLFEYATPPGHWIKNKTAADRKWYRTGYEAAKDGGHATEAAERHGAAPGPAYRAFYRGWLDYQDSNRTANPAKLTGPISAFRIVVRGGQHILTRGGKMLGSIKTTADLNKLVKAGVKFAASAGNKVVKAARRVVRRNPMSQFAAGRKIILFSGDPRTGSRHGTAMPYNKRNMAEIKRLYSITPISRSQMPAHMRDGNSKSVYYMVRAK